MKMKASDAIANILSMNNVTYGFELIGGMIAHIIDSINLLGDTKLVSMHHEQGASFAAGAISRVSNHAMLGLALGTSGPGATNLITGITDCWFDSHPCIFITGQVNTHELKNGLAIRQQGFQEMDIVSIVKSITKYAYQITDPKEIIPCFQKAIDIAIEGRPGPVLIDIPMNLQNIMIEDAELKALATRDKENINVDAFHCQALDSQLKGVFDEINRSKRPLFLIGGGAVNEANFKLWLKFIEMNNFCGVASLKGCEKVTATNNYLGLIGAYGTRAANYAVQNCDLLIVIGSRMDVRQTGANVNDFASQAKIIQIDIDRSQLDNRVLCSTSIEMKSELFFKYFMDFEFHSNSHRNEWKNKLIQYFDATFIDEYTDWKISPFNLFKAINQLFVNQKIEYVADVGNNQMWAAHSLRLTSTQAAHYSGGLGAMGFAIPTAIGAHYVDKSSVVVITGDGGAQLNIQELDIIAREKLPILILVMNNSSLGMVRGFQEMYFEGRNSSTYWQGYTSNFKDIANAYNLESYAVETLDACEQFIKSFIENPRPCLLEIIMSDARECRPRLEFGNPIDKQSPLLKDCI